MGPPRSAPFGPGRWYFTASSFSPKLVIIPSRAEIHIQNTAPGPPRVSAVATPAMDPVPMVEASAVAKAWSGESPPLVFSRRRNSVPAVARHQVRNWKIWNHPEPMEYTSPVIRNSPSSQGVQRASAIRDKKSTAYHLKH